MTNDMKNVSGAQFTQPPEDFKVRSATAIISLASDDLQPPMPYYVGVDDNLLIQYTTLFSGNTLIVNVRILRPDGIIVPLQFRVANVFTAFATPLQVQLIEGYLLSVSLNTLNPSTGQNTNYASVSLVRSPNTIQAQYLTLFSGYVYRNAAMGWPASAPQRETDGAGGVADSGVMNIPAPGAGADWVYTVPSNVRVRVTSVSGLLTTAVAVANRLPSLIVDDGATAYAMIPSNNTQAASLAEQYTWADSIQYAALFDSKVSAPLVSQLIIPAGHRVRSNTTGIQAADQWSNLRMLGQFWAELG